MRRYTFYLSVALFAFGFYQQNVYCQDEAETKPLIQRWLRGDNIQTGVVSLRTFEKPTKDEDFGGSVNVSLIDLNGDGKKELAIQDGCAAVGNCGLEVYIKVGETYKTLLTADMVQTIKVLKTKTNNYFDLEFRTHGSAFESYHRIFKFNGKSYKRNKCWNESYQILDKKGNTVQLKKPKITYGCGEEY